MIVKIMDVRVKNGISEKTKMPWEIIGIRTTEYPNTWHSCFANKVSVSLKAGDEIDVNLTKNGKYDNFEIISGYGVVEKKESKMEELEKRIKALEDMMING